MKVFLVVFAAVILAGAVLIGFVNHSKKEEAKWEHVLDLGNQNVFTSAKLCVMEPTRERVESFRDAVKRQREVLAQGVGPEQARIKAKSETDKTLDSIVSYLEVKTLETKELAKLLEGL